MSEISTKFCPKCKTNYPATPEFFHRNRATSDGFQHQCKNCHMENTRTSKLSGKPAKPRDKVTEIIPEGFKPCTICKDILPATTEYFHSDKSHADGLRSQCRNCRCKIVQDQRRENPERERANRQRFYQNHTERVKKKVRDYMDKNREKRTEYEREYWRQNKDKKQAKSTRRKAAKRNLPNTFTAQDWERCLTYWGNRCAACGREPDGATVILSPDHWIALTDPRPDNPGTVPTNIVPLCNSLKGGRNGCNNSKHKRKALTWLVERFGVEEAEIILARIQAYFESLREFSEMA